MSFVAYAPNLEDVLLARVFAGLSDGRYLDVGAGDPQRGSLTLALYQRGWHGLNLEPRPALARALRIARPADVTLEVLPGAAAGSAVFYEAPGYTGFDAAQAHSLAATGETVVQREVALQPLAALCAAHLDGPLHLLRLGADSVPAALAGMDWQRCRPWLVLAQSAQAEAPDWQARLEAANYRPVYFDGANRWYLAQEQAALAAAFATPPHAADDFTLCEDHALAWPTAALRARVADAELRADQASRTTTETLTWVKEWERAQEEKRVQVERWQAAAERVAELEARDAAQRDLIQHLEFSLHGTLNSLSWRVTRPLRGANRLARAVLRRVKRGAAFLRGKLARVAGAAAGIAKRVVRKLVHSVVSRPALAHFLRRLIARHPRLMTLARNVLLRSKAAQHPQTPSGAPQAADTSQLSAPARQVLAQLNHTMHSRRP